MPAESRDTLRRYEAVDDYQNPEYIAAPHEYDRRHVVCLPQMHPDYAEAVRAMQADPTVYYTINGPNEFHVVGSIRTWSIIDRLDQINVPTLLYVFAAESMIGIFPNSPCLGVSPGLRRDQCGYQPVRGVLAEADEPDLPDHGIELHRLLLRHRRPGAVE